VEERNAVSWSHGDYKHAIGSLIAAIGRERSPHRTLVVRNLPDGPGAADNEIANLAVSAGAILSLANTQPVIMQI
jgi:hypothetical protein